MQNNKSKYCSDYNRKIEELLDKALVEIAMDAKELPSAKSVEFLVLGGSYGRGEGGICGGQTDNPKLFNDLDFFVICDSKTDSEKAIKINAEYAQLSKKWTRELGIDVDFGPATRSDEIVKKLDALMWREMVCGGIVCLGDKDEFKEKFLRAIPEKIEPHEFAKLLFNRTYGFTLAQYLRAQKSYPEFSVDEKNFISRNINKALLACGDAVCTSQNLYALKTADKLGNLKAIVARTPENEFFQKVSQTYADAAEFKRNPKQECGAEAFETNSKKAAALIADVRKNLSAWLRSEKNPSIKTKLKNLLKNILLSTRFFALGKSVFLHPFTNPLLTAFDAEVDLIEKADFKNLRKKSALENIWKRIN